jgi:hypothetical protein
VRALGALKLKPEQQGRATMSRKRSMRAHHPGQPEALDIRALIDVAISKTSKAIWFTALPTVSFMIFAGFAIYSDHELRSQLTKVSIDQQVNRWLYYSFFSLASILLYKIYDDYGNQFLEKKFIFILYICIFLSFANNFMAALMHELATLKESNPPTDIVTMSLSYTLAAVLMFIYLAFRENDLRKMQSTITPMTTPQPSLFGITLDHVTYWSIPILVTIAISIFLTWSLSNETDIKHVMSNFVFFATGLSSIVFPIYQRIQK